MIILFPIAGIVFGLGLLACIASAVGQSEWAPRLMRNTRKYVLNTTDPGPRLKMDLDAQTGFSVEKEPTSVHGIRPLMVSGVALMAGSALLTFFAIIAEIISNSSQIQ